MRITLGWAGPWQDDLSLGRVAHRLRQALKVEQTDHGGGGRIQLVVGWPAVRRENESPILGQSAGKLRAAVLLAGKAQPFLGRPGEDLDHPKTAGPQPLGQGNSPAGQLHHGGQGCPEDPKPQPHQLPVAPAGNPELPAGAVRPEAAAAGGQG